MNLLKITGVTLLTTALPSMSAQTFTALNFTFEEPAFTAGTINGTSGYNLINDSTGVKLAADNGDRDDLFITVSNSIPGSASGAFAGVTIESGGGLRSNHGFTNPFDETYTPGTGNNTGALISQTIRVTFGSHLTIDDFATDFNSLNTRGITWEHSQFAFLQPDGSYFSGAPTIGDHGSWEAATNPLPTWNIGNETAGNGGSGSPSIGWFVAAATDTVVNVGSDQTVSGGSGSRENLTGTNGNSILDYDDVGLAPGTQIGGFEWTVFLEDTRGQNNNSSEWTATQNFFEISGAVPEPSTGLFCAIAMTGFLFRRQVRG